VVLVRRRAYLALAAGALAGCAETGTLNRSCPVDETVNPGTAAWPTATGDRRNTRSVPRAATPDPPLSVEWTRPLEEFMGVAPPTVADGVVYTTNMDTVLHAVDAAGGETLWSAPIERAGVPVVADDWVVAATDTGSLVAFDRANGDRTWTVELSAGDPYLYAAPTAAAGLALVPTSLGLSAFDLATGERRWEYPLGLSVGRHPAVVEGTVYATAGDAYLHAVDAGTGARVWWEKTSGPMETPPAVVEGTVYAATTGGTVLAVDAETGAREWTAAVDARVERLAVDGGFVYVGGDDGLTAIRADSGERCWRYGGFDASYAGGIAASPDRVYVTASGGDVGGTDDTVVALDPTDGGVEWRFDSGDHRLTSGPAVVDGAVYVGGVVSGTGLATVRLA